MLALRESSGLEGVMAGYEVLYAFSVKHGVPHLAEDYLTDQVWPL